MKVLHFTNAYPSEERPVFGIFVREQIDSLAQCGVDGDVLFLDGRMGWPAYRRAVRELRQRANEYDIIHCHHMICGFLAVMSGVRVPTVVSFMSDGARNYKGRIPGLGVLMFEITSRLSGANIYKSRVPDRFASKSIFLPNGVDEQAFAIRDRAEACRRLGLDPSRRWLLFVSANDPDRPEKRLDLFRQIVVAAQEKIDGRYEGLVMSDARRDDVPWFYVAAETHLLTSDVEGSPNSVKESLAAGTPVVGRNVGSVRELLDGVSGCVCVEGTGIPAYVNGVRRAAQADAQRVRADFLAKGLSREAVARRLADLYLGLKSSSLAVRE
jgi:glycosyltransferase involved in cell wall biosynthesis